MEGIWFRKDRKGSDGVIWERFYPPTVQNLRMMISLRRLYHGVLQLLANASQLRELTLDDLPAAETISTMESDQALQDPAEQKAYEDMKWNRWVAALEDLSLEE